MGIEGRWSGVGVGVGGRVVREVATVVCCRWLAPVATLRFHQSPRRRIFPPPGKTHLDLIVLQEEAGGGEQDRERGRERGVSG